MRRVALTRLSTLRRKVQRRQGFLRLAPAIILLTSFLAFSQDFDTDFLFGLPTSQQLDARLKELKDSEGKFPENDVIFAKEVDRLEKELDGYKKNLEYIQQRAQQPVDYAQKRQQAEALIKDLDALNCSTLKGGMAGYLSKLSEIRKGQNFFPGDVSNPWQFEVKGSSDKEICASLKAATGGDTRRQQLLDKLNADGDAYKKQLAQDAVLQPKIKDVISAVQSRIDKMDTRSTKKSLTGYLFYLVGTIGGLSILTLLAVKTFPDAQQLEWITSGQVIQFVTVMNLLAVVMALGLVDILHENTIGTILGGVGGYVLSQGVGRAAAREVSRVAASIRPPGGGG
jgi:hypothetical protein